MYDIIKFFSREFFFGKFFDSKKLTFRSKQKILSKSFQKNEWDLNNRNKCKLLRKLTSTNLSLIKFKLFWRISCWKFYFFNKKIWVKKFREFIWSRSFLLRDKNFGPSFFHQSKNLYQMSKRYQNAWKKNVKC